jgi:hypothetical protein
MHERSKTMLDTITTLDEVKEEYGPLVGGAVEKLLSYAPDASIGFLVDIVVGVVEDTMSTLGFDFERKEGF